MRPFVFVGGGLGDVARRLYVTNSYEVLENRQETIHVCCFSHNPAALEFFRFHPSHRHIVLYDMGHLYMNLLADKSVDRKEINRTIFQQCGLVESEQLTKNHDPKPMRHFYAPDHVKGPGGHIVLHPFARGWKDWPKNICDLVRAALRDVPPTTQVYVISADYVSTDGRTKVESFPCDLPNVRLLKNLSAPAAFTLVATASRFVGTMSALAQVAAFEQVPSMVLHPARCTDFLPPYSNYSKTIWNANGVAIPYDKIAPEPLEESLRQFLADPARPLVMREEFQTIAPFPVFP